MCEIEFYLDDGDKHSDSFAHKDPIQMLGGKWYLHRLVPTKRNSFKCASYKGFDLAFGSKDKNVYGGILIRALYDKDEKRYIEGPCNSVLELMKHSQGVTEFKDLERTSDEHDGDAFDSANKLWYLRKSNQIVKAPFDLIKSPRVGLTLKRYSLDKEIYWLKPYRYLSMPHLCKKQAILV